MPVKGKTTKSRTAKSKGKGLKLKWWYILPVIAIVAVAGYAIVRYSQASVPGSQIYRKVGQNIIANRIVRKSNGASYAIIGNGGFALTEWTASEARSRDLACVTLKSTDPKKNFTAVITLTSYYGDSNVVATKRSITERGFYSRYDRNFATGGCYDYAKTGKLRMQVDGITNGGEFLLDYLVIQRGA
jgi:hypothetical protein